MRATPLVENPEASTVSELASVARQFSVTLFSSIAGAVLGLSLTLILTRGVGASAAGAFFVTTAVFTICSSVLTFGADLGAMRMIAR